MCDIMTLLCYFKFIWSLYIATGLDHVWSGDDEKCVSVNMCDIMTLVHMSFFMRLRPDDRWLQNINASVGACKRNIFAGLPFFDYSCKWLLV